MNLPDGFELSPHVSGTRPGRWYKSINGKRYYFGPLNDPDGALVRYNYEGPYLRKGLPVPPPDSERPQVLTLGDLSNRWLHSIATRAPRDRVADSTFDSYKRSMRHLLEVLGRDTPVGTLTPGSFDEVHKSIVTQFENSPTNANKRRAIIKTMFKWAYDYQHIQVPMAMGTFRAAKQGDVRQRQHELGRQTYTAEEIQELLRIAREGVKGRKWEKGKPRVAGLAPSPDLEAFILLGINAAMTQKEIADLRWRDLKLKIAMLDSLRPKSKIYRKAKLWPETVAAIKASIEAQQFRGRPGLEPGDRVFLTRRGLPWVEEGVGKDGKFNRRDSVRQQFNKATKAAGIELKQAGFGKMRATFRTIADGCLDQVAVKLVMGHAPGNRVDESYNRLLQFDTDRLQAVSGYVKSWLDVPQEAGGSVIGRIG